MTDLIWTPKTPGFYETLFSRPAWGDNYSFGDLDFRIYGVRHESGLLEPLVGSELDDYVLGGEYDEVTNEQEDEFD